LHQTNALYQIALDVKHPSKGDSNAKGRGQIEEAATQVCRELNGLIEFFYKHPFLIAPGSHAAFVPVILTTANLWATNYELSTAAPDTGKMAADKLRVEAVDWLWYQYHQSPGLLHSRERSNQHKDIAGILYQEFVRPIAIVTPTGLKSFLEAGFWKVP